MAYLFKTFTVVPEPDNSGVLFGMNDPVAITALNDNFAQQVQIHINELTGIDIFEYKYVTFDNFTFFEITDVVINGEYATIFVQYVSRLKNGFVNPAVETDFMVGGVTAKRLVDLGLDINDIISILDVTDMNPFDRWGIITPTPNNPNTSDVTVPAFKIKMSQIPDGLRWVQSNSTGGAPYSFVVADSSITSEYSKYSNVDFGVIEYGPQGNSLNDSDAYFGEGGYTFFIPLHPFTSTMFVDISYVPYGSNNSISIGAGKYNMAEAFSTLRDILSDLVQSVELTIMSRNTFLINPENTTTLEQSTISRVIDSDVSIGIDVTGFANQHRHILYTQSATISTSPTGGKYINGAPLIRIGNKLIENYSWHRVIAERDTSGPIMTSDIPMFINVFGNRIDISGYKSLNYVLKRGENIITLYPMTPYGATWDAPNTSLYPDLSNGTEISTQIEYSKNALSNYYAYEKSNLGLTQSAQRNALALSQKNQRQLFDYQGAVNITTSVLNELSSFDFLGALSAGVGGATQFALDRHGLEIQQQNTRAELALAEKEQHNLLKNIIRPTNTQYGTLSLENAFNSIYITGVPAQAMIRFTFMKLNRNQLITLAKYLMKNKIVNRIYSANDMSTPEWIQSTGMANRIFQTDILTSAPSNTRKPFTVYTDNTYIE